MGCLHIFFHFAENPLWHSYSFMEITPCARGRGHFINMKWSFVLHIWTTTTEEELNRVTSCWKWMWIHFLSIRSLHGCYFDTAVICCSVKTWSSKISALIAAPASYQLSAEQVNLKERKPPLLDFRTWQPGMVCCLDLEELNDTRLVSVKIFGTLFRIHFLKKKKRFSWSRSKVRQSVSLCVSSSVLSEPFHSFSLFQLVQHHV